ncbi:MAG TPA: folylpolyglutamate synthase/dihydrofolate synthase family protein [Terracidiphilus sp.]|nr:folylpolyglutamate synthase/dihydrofolate synthase family protein [Terracidiphilus sp.]
MSYAAAIDQLAAMTPELHTQPGQPRRKFSLDEIGVLLKALGNPHRKFPAVLIAGTNGKGSTAATLASILNESGLSAAAGLRTGLYTSPHLTRPNERIRVSGVEISDEQFAALYFRVHDTGQQLVMDRKLAQLPSFFECLTALAFLHFAEGASGAGPVDFAVLEVGMGGRLDATNIVDPLLSVITDISLDHTEWLGSTIAAIAREKAGILRPNGTLITLPQHPEANHAIGEIALALNVRALSAVPYMPSVSGHDFSRAESFAKKQEGASTPAKGTGFSPYATAPMNEGALAPAPYTITALGEEIEIDSPLHGAHQHRNIALAIAAAVELAERHNLPITPASISAGVRNTQWPARLERITTHSSKGLASTQWILDVAHNPAGAWALRAGLRQLVPEGTPLTLVFSCLRDKPLAEMAQILFPLFDRVVFAPITSPRATPMAELLAAAASTGTPAQAAASVAEALVMARATQAGQEPQTPASGHDFSRAASPHHKKGALAPERTPAVIVISGSVYLVGEARAFLLAEDKP